MAKEKGFTIRNVEIGDEDHIRIFAFSPSQDISVVYSKNDKGNIGEANIFRVPGIKT